MLRWLRLTPWMVALTAVLVLPRPGITAGLEDPLPPLQIRLAQALGQSATGSAPGGMALSLREAIAISLQNNLDVTVEGYNPRLREQELINARAAYDPTAFLEGTRTESRNPVSASFVTKPGANYSLWDWNTGIREQLPTGGSYEFRFNNEYLRSQALGNSYTSRLILTLNQPLLRNFGFEVNLTNIRIATNNQSISREQLRLRVSTVVTSVQNAYFDLIFAVENLGVQQRSLSLAQDLVTLNQARVRAGVAAPVEVTQAEAQRAAQVQNVILAEKAIRDAEDNLRVILNLPATGAAWGQELRPTDSATFLPVQTDLDAAIKAALENRNEYRSAKLDIDNRELQVRLARNQLLPDLSLQGIFSLAGGQPVYADALSQLGTPTYPTYTVGVVLTVPIGNRAAESNYIHAELSRDQGKASLRGLELTIVQQVREGVRRVEAFARRVDANRAARVLAEEQLRVEQRRLEAGVSTTFNVLSFQRDLAAAQANEIQAITDYNKALANLDSVQGTVLERNRIQM